MLNQLKKNNKYLACIINNNITINIAIIILNNYNKFYTKLKQDSFSLEQLKKQIYSKFKY